MTSKRVLRSSCGSDVGERRRRIIEICRLISLPYRGSLGPNLDAVFKQDSADATAGEVLGEGLHPGFANEALFRDPQGPLEALAAPIHSVPLPRRPRMTRAMD